MNRVALANNWAAAKRSCCGVFDRFKYLLWVYDIPGKLGVYRRRALRVRFALSNPVGNVTLAVRSNKGSDFFIFSEVFEHRYYDFDLPKPPRTILDAGANVGFTTLFLGRKYPTAQLACVEPIPQNVALLRENLRENLIHATIYPKALSISNSPIQIEVSTKDYGHKVAEMRFGARVGGRKVEVPAITVTTIMKDLSWPTIDLMKIDIEGYEGILLREKCDWLRNVETICIECHEEFSEIDLWEVAKLWGFGLPARLRGAWLLQRYRR